MIINGDALTILKRTKSNSIDMGINSPPYYSPGEGLREYKPECVITWPDGWNGQLGTEPTPQQYVSHLSLICMEFHRVLRPMGPLLVNIGDSRAGSGRGPSGKNAMIKNQEQRQGFVGKHQIIPEGFKRKDMFAVPFRLGIALQEMGFIWRACIPWLKRNGAIASYKDRPVDSIEWILILQKQEKNYYDYIGVMQQASESYNNDKRPRGVLRQKVNKNTKYDRDNPQYRKQDNTGNPTYTGLNARYAENGSCDKRMLRSSDFFFKTWQGLWCDQEGQPLALVVNPSGSKWKHTASFPVLLPQTFINAYTSEKGNCPSCGSPFVRMAHKEYSEDHSTYQIITDGWNPTCSCDTGAIPPVVMDYFAGTSATGVACKNTGRNYIGIEVSPEYVEIGHQRIKEGK
jgi:DNA modification methylase